MLEVLGVDLVDEVSATPATISGAILRRSGMAPAVVLTIDGTGYRSGWYQIHTIAPLCFGAVMYCYVMVLVRNHCRLQNVKGHLVSRRGGRSTNPVLQILSKRYHPASIGAVLFASDVFRRHAQHLLVDVV